MENRTLNLNYNQLVNPKLNRIFNINTNLIQTNLFESYLRNTEKISQ